jgi:uncharacterized protein
MLADFYNDPDHSNDETRMIVIGHSDRGSLLFVSFIDNEDNNIRIISARRVTRSERIQYEEKENRS